MSASVSFVIPTFNDDPDHIREAVASAIGQSRLPEEVVVVDDGSTRPESVAALDALRGVTLVRKANGGPSAARNAGIRAATGEFIVTLDGDDWIDPGFVAEAMAVMGGADVEVAYPSVRVFGLEDGLRPAYGDVRLADLMDMNKVPSAAMFRRNRWEAVDGFQEGLDGQEDYAFWVRMLRDGGMARPVPAAQLHYRLRAATAGSEYWEATRKAIISGNADHHEALLRAAFERLDELRADLAEQKRYVQNWQRRARPLIAVRNRIRSLLGG